MDNTFNIDPTSPLAIQAADQVRKIAEDTFVSVRGEWFHDREIFYGVFALEKGDHPSKYMWKYQLASAWLAEYDELGL